MVLSYHFGAIERHLLAASKIPAGSGHSVHKGTAREAFIRDFLRGHLSERVAIGTGEIIDSRSQPAEPRPQMDIVIYGREFPRVDFGGWITGFLIESAVATIEVKSTLTYVELKKAVKAASRIKALEPSWGGGGFYQQGWVPSSVKNYLVAYAGPARMATVRQWLERAYGELNLEYPEMPPTLAARQELTAPGLDCVVVLGKGFVQFDNFPMSVVPDEVRVEEPHGRWITAASDSQGLLWLFLVLTRTIGATLVRGFDPTRYVEGTNFRIEFD